jgi:hypothetical protein
MYNTIIFSVVLEGCEMWFVIFREKHKPRLFGNRKLMKTFGPKRKEVTGKWRKICNEQLQYLYSSPNVIQVKKSKTRMWAGHVVVWEKIIAHSIWET